MQPCTDMVTDSNSEHVTPTNTSALPKWCADVLVFRTLASFIFSDAKDGNFTIAIASDKQDEGLNSVHGLVKPALGHQQAMQCELQKMACDSFPGARAFLRW